jgi:hypothetical protein
MSNIFTVETLVAMQRDLKRFKLHRSIANDDKVEGLRAIITRDTITLHVRYGVGEERPFLSLGTLDEISIERARVLTTKILAIAATGVDPVKDMRRGYIASLEAA